MADEELGKLVIKLRLDLAEMKKSAEEGQEATRSLAEGIKGSWTELNSQKEIVTTAFGMINQAIDATVGKSVEYAAQVRQMMREVGVSAEDASKLIQASDDVGVSFDTLQQGMRMAIKNGIAPTMEGMAQLADQYVAIQDPVERTRFLFDKFGKSGAELGPLMELGAKGIREAGQAAEDAGLVMDEKAVKAAREYEIAVDNLGDKLNAIAISTGNKLIPALTDAANAYLTLAEWSDRMGNQLRQHHVDVLKTATSYEAYSAEIDRAAKAAGYFVDTEGNLRRGRGELIESNFRVSETTFEIKRAYEESGTAVDAWAVRWKDHATPAVQDQTTAILDNKAALDTVMGSMKSVTAEMIFQKAAANMDAEAALELGRSMGVINDQSYFVLSSLDQLKAKYDANADGLIDAKEAAAGYTEEVARLSYAYASITDKKVTLSIDVIAPENFAWAEWLDDKRVKKGFATGADFVVPPGYPNDSFGPIYVESGEHVQVTTAGETGMNSAAMLSILSDIRAALGNLQGGVAVSIDARGSSPVDLEYLAYQVANVINAKRRR